MLARQITVASLLVSVGCAVAGVPGIVNAQCVGVRTIVDPEQGYAFTPDGFTETMAGVVGWDPDGAGPSEPWTVFNGTFRRAATTIGNGMVAFDGRAWIGFDLPDSLGVPSVRQTFVHDGELYAAAGMIDEGLNAYRVWRRWNGSQWVAAGPLSFNTTDNASNPARVVSFAGDIIAVGLSGYRTGDATQPPRSLLARADSTQDVFWEAAGPSLSEFSGTVRAAVVSGSDLYVGGTLTGVGAEGAIANIARWDGTQLHALGAGLNGEVSDIFVDGANVYVTGAFTHAGDVPLVGMGVWNGTSWQQVGDGLLGDTRSVAVHDGVVYVVAHDGNFENVYRLEGGEWVVDARTDQPVPPSSTAAPSRVSLEVANGALYMVGRFRGVSARGIQAAAVRVMGPDGVMWAPPSGGFNAPISSMVVYRDRLLASGSFSRAGVEFVARIAEWDGQHWGQSDVPTPPGTLVAIGDELYSLAELPSRVYRFDGTAWTPVGEIITAEDGVAAGRASLTEFEGDLYLAPSMSNNTTTNAGVRLQRWNGTQWEGVGGVIMRENESPIANGLAVVQDQLYVLYYADTLDGEPFSGGLLRWDGQQMSVMQHTGGQPWEIISGGDALEAIHRLPNGGSSPDVSTVLVGDDWVTTGVVPAGAGDRFLSQLLAVGEDRYALMYEYASAVLESETLVKLDRQSGQWLPVSDLIHFPTNTLPEQFFASSFMATTPVVVDSEIHLFGTFSRIGTQTAVNWARFTTNGVPLIVEQPGDVTVRCGGSVALRVGVANGYEDDGALQYQWYLNGEALSETQFIRGVNTDTLSIPALLQPFAGTYSVTVTGACGTATSREAFVAGDSPECQACAPCAADFDSDGGVTAGDVAMFFSAFEAGAACADVDRDGGVTGGDIAAFFTLYEAGGC